MNPGVGNGILIFEITNGIAKDELQRRYSAGDYGPKGERMTPQNVARYWQMIRGNGKASK